MGASSVLQELSSNEKRGKEEYGRFDLKYSIFATVQSIKFSMHSDLQESKGTFSLDNLLVGWLVVLGLTAL